MMDDEAGIRRVAALQAAREHPDMLGKDHASPLQARIKFAASVASLLLILTLSVFEVVSLFPLALANAYVLVLLKCISLQQASWRCERKGQERGEGAREMGRQAGQKKECEDDCGECGDRYSLKQKRLNALP